MALGRKGESPATKECSEEVMEDIIRKRKTTAAEHVMNMEHDSEPEAEEDDHGETVTASQQVAINSLQLKKLEKKRKERDQDSK